MPAVVTDILQTRLEMVGLGQYVSGITQAAGALGLLEVKLDAMGRRQLALATGFGVASAALVGGMAKAVGQAGRFQQIEIGFTTILKSADAAKAKMLELQKFAEVTPFRFEDTATLAKQLMAMGISADDTVPVMRDLGDAVAALGLGSETLQRVVFNFGQIKTLGKVTMREMRDFAMNGIPVFEILQEELGLTKTQLQHIGDAGIDAEKMLDALRRGLQKRFGGAMEAQNKTLAGSFSNLQDSAQRAAAAIGKPWLDPTVSVIRGGQKVLDMFNKLPNAIKDSTGVVIGAAAMGLAALAMRHAMAMRSIIKQAMLNIAVASGAAKATGIGGVGGAAGHVAVMHVTAGRVNIVGGGGGVVGGFGGGGSGGGSGGSGAAGAAGGAAAAAAMRAQSANNAYNNAALRVQRAEAQMEAAIAAKLKAKTPAAVQAATDRIIIAQQAIANARIAADSAWTRAAQAQIKANPGGGGVGQVIPTFFPPAADVAKGGVKAGVKAAMGRVGGALSSPGAIVAAIVAEIALAFLPDNGNIGTVKRVLQGTITGASIGGLLGSLAGPKGTAAGVLIGGLLGGGAAGFNERRMADEEAKAKKAEAGNTDPAVEQLKRIADLLDKIQKKTSPIGYDEASQYEQIRYVTKALGRA